jgi:hypothetical protein
MNYKKIYDDLMSTRILLKPQRIKQKSCGFYFEGHHIIPKWMGGSGNSNRPKNNPNIVLLTAREHFLSHWLLWRIYRNRPSSLAFHRMISRNGNQTRITSSRGYEEARESYRITNLGNKYGLDKKRIVSEEQKKKQSEMMKGKYDGEKNPFFGKKHNDITKEKIRKSRVDKKKDKIWNYFGKRILLKNNLVVGIFETSDEIADFIGCSKGNVRHVLSGNQKTAKGYVIKYLKEYYDLLK